MDFDKIRSNIDLKVYDGIGGRDFCQDVEDAFGSEFRCLHPDVKSKIHYMAYERGHSAGYHNTLNQYFDLIELTTCMLKTMC